MFELKIFMIQLTELGLEKYLNSTQLNSRTTSMLRLENTEQSIIDRDQVLFYFLSFAIFVVFCPCLPRILARLDNLLEHLASFEI